MVFLVLAILFCFARFGRFGCFGGFVSVISLVSFRWFRFVVSGFSTCRFESVQKRKCSHPMFLAENYLILVSLKVMLHGTTCNNDFSRNTASTFHAMLHESTFRATPYKMNLATCMLHETILHATRLTTFCVSKQRASRPCKQR